MLRNLFAKLTIIAALIPVGIDFTLSYLLDRTPLILADTILLFWQTVICAAPMAVGLIAAMLRKAALEARSAAFTLAAFFIIVAGWLWYAIDGYTYVAWDRSGGANIGLGILLLYVIPPISTTLSLVASVLPSRKPLQR